MCCIEKVISLLKFINIQKKCFAYNARIFDETIIMIAISLYVIHICYILNNTSCKLIVVVGAEMV